MKNNDPKNLSLFVKLKNNPNPIIRKLSASEQSSLFSACKDREQSVMNTNGLLTIRAVKKVFSEFEKMDIERVLFNVNGNEGFIPNHHIATRERIEKCVSIICGTGVDFVSSKEHFTDDLDMDSLDYVELMLDLEHEFDLDIPDEDVSEVKTISQAVEYIKSRS